MIEKIVAGIVIAIVVTVIFTIIAFALDLANGANFFETCACVAMTLAILVAISFAAFKLFPWSINTLFGG